MDSITMCQSPWGYSKVCVYVCMLGGGYKMLNLHFTMDFHLNQLLLSLPLQKKPPPNFGWPAQIYTDYLTNLLNPLANSNCNQLVNSNTGVSDVRLCLRFFIFIACFYIHNTKHNSIQSHHIFTRIQRHLMTQIRPHPLSPF